MAQSRNVRGLLIAVTPMEISALQNPHGESSSQARPRGKLRAGDKYMPDDPWNEWREKIEASKNSSKLSGDEERAGVETMLQIMEEQRRRAGIANSASKNPPARNQAAIDSLTLDTARDECTPSGQLSEAAAFLLQTSRPVQVQMDRIHYCGTCKQRFSTKSKKKLHNKTLAHVTYECGQCMDQVFLSRCRFNVHWREVHRLESPPDDLLAGRVESTTHDAAPNVVPTGPCVPSFAMPEGASTTLPSTSVLESEPSSVPTTNPLGGPATVMTPLGTAGSVGVPSKFPAPPEGSFYRTETAVEAPPCTSSNTVDAPSDRGPNNQNVPENSTVLPDNITAQTTMHIYPRRQCGVCKQTFSTPKNRNLHVQVSTLLAYRCADCNKNFRTRCMFAVHQMDVHEIGYSRDGILAVQAVTTQSAAPAHATTSDASLGELVQDSAPSLRQHGISGSMNATAGQEGMPVETVPLEYVYHEKTHYHSDGATSAAVDGGAAENRPNTSGNLECSTCGVSLQSKGSMKRHSKIRFPGTQMCALCSEGFSTRCQLNIHRKQVHGGDSSGPRAPSIQVTADQDGNPSAASVQHMSSDVLPQLACKSTHASTRDGSLGQSALDASPQPFVQPLEARQPAPAGDNVSLSQPGPIRSPQEETLVNKYWRVCQNCRSFFSSSELLSTHQKQLHEEHDCPRCTKTYDSACTFYAHRNLCRDQPAAILKKPPPTEYQCCDCKMKFFDSKGLESHFRSCKAVKRNLFECQLCKTRFQSQKKLDKHSRKCKKIPCLSTTFKMGSSPTPAKSNKKVCQKRFTTIAGMTDHLESGGCVSKLDRLQINSLIVQHDHEQTITLPAAASISSINPAAFHTPPRALQTPAAVIEIFGDDSDSDVEVIFTPSTTAPGSTSGILTPASGYSIVPLDSKSCPTCGARFATKIGAAQHFASPVHDLPRYRCPSDLFFTELGLQLPSDGARHQKTFKTLAGLVVHVERGRCRDGNDGRKVVTELLRRLTGGDMVGLLGGGSA